MVGYGACLRRQPTARTPRDDAGLGEHRSPAGAAFAPGDLTAYIRATWDLTPDVIAYVDGCASTERPLERSSLTAAHGTSQDGFDAEWRADRRCDGRWRPDQPLRDCSTRQTSTPRSQGSTNSVVRHHGWTTRQAEFERFWAYFSVRDWAAMADIFADDLSPTIVVGW